MKAGVRALGIAESYRGRHDEGAESVLGGAVVRADRVVDGVALSTCTVGGTDATEAVCRLFADLGREDVRALFLAGVAPAWFNVLDLDAIAERTERPVVSVAFEGSPGLASALREQFDGRARDARLDRYRRLPDPRAVALPDGTRYARAVGLDDDDAERLVRAFTPEGGRPEPLRVAREVARAGRRFRGADADSA